MILTYILRSSEFCCIYVNPRDHVNYNACSHQTLHTASPWHPDLACSMTRSVILTYILCLCDCVDPWDLVFYNSYNHQILHIASYLCLDSAGMMTLTLTYISSSSDFVTFNFDTRDFVNYKASSNHTLHKASPGCPNSVRTLALLLSISPFWHYLLVSSLQMINIG